MQVPFVDLKAQYRSIQMEIDEAIQRVLDHTGFIGGEEVSQFEADFGSYIGTGPAVGVASGTAALELALRACDIGDGDEVITTAHTFFATAEAISNVGATPVFADIDAATFNIEPNRVESAITDRTRAVLPVHLYGRPADLDALADICQRHSLRLIEDAAQAHGARSRDRACGSIGDLACFSFYPGKNLGAYGDAGAVTGDPHLLARVKKLRDHGRVSKYEHDEIGHGERLDSIQAAVLAVKLLHLTEWTDARRRHATTYDQLLLGSGVSTPTQDPLDRHSFHLYVIRSSRRDELLAALAGAGVSAGIHYPIPLHRQPAYIRLGYDDCRLPATESAATEVLSLPIFPELSMSQIEYIADHVQKFAK